MCISKPVVLYYLLYDTDTDILREVSAGLTTNQSGDFCTNSSHNALNDLYSPTAPGDDTDLCRRCSVAIGTTPSWWAVNLGRKHLVAGIRVFGRVDSKAYTCI